MIREISLYSLNSKASYIHPIEKIIPTISSLILCSYIENPYVILINILIFIVLNFASKSPIKIVKKFIIISLSFFIFTAITLVWQSYSLNYILILFLRAINGAVSIAFLALTTPINHMVYIISKNEVGRDVADIIKSMERFLIIIEGDFLITKKAIKSRAGFQSFKSGIQDFGKLCGVTFSNLMNRWKEINLSLKNRCYNGRHNYNYSFKLSKIRLMCIAFYVLLIFSMDTI